MKKEIKIAIAVVVVVILAFVLWPRPKGEPLEQYRMRVIAEVNQDLASPHNQVFKIIESAYPTVTAKSGKVTTCSVRTVDGSDNAGKNGSNVAEIDLVVTVNWDGWVQKGGYTEFEWDYDNQNKIVKKTAFLRSNAAIDWPKVDWFKVGFVIGQTLAAVL